MKILLLGDYSGLHKSLQEGLEKLNFDATLASSGDSWKKIDRDIDISFNDFSIFGKLKNRSKIFNFLTRIKGYDVVQFVNPFVMPPNFFPYKYVLQKLKQNNGKIFLVAAGSDPFFWRYASKRLRYNPLTDHLKYDLNQKFHRYQKKFFFDKNLFFAENVNAVIPALYEYEVCYKDLLNVTDVIPPPINTDTITYTDNIVQKKVKIFHGLNRPGFKGTHLLREVFQNLKPKYQDKVEFTIPERMPYKEYIKVLEGANVVIDQTNSYSLGVNGLLALAMGKIVLGGYEEESLISLGIAKAPSFNILPDTVHIQNTIESVICNENKFLELGKKSRSFIEEHFSYIKIAKKYIDVWEKY
tara:strand:+ start:2780 stop:3847 length:1068 start_codon:yes stop_codon:yes gene_type:complete